VRCGTCGAATRRGAKFCDQCGSQLGDVVLPKRRAASGATEVEPGDRRIVTALFADLVDYVRLVAEHDPEDVRRQVDQALMAMVEAIEAFGGTREKFIGDAVFAVFGWPNGHDDDALRASHCGLAIREALSRVGASTSEEPLQVRIGIATGEVVAAPRGDGSGDWSLTGPAVTTAARIQTIAQPGEILLDEATLRATRKGFEVEDRGPQLLRGQTRPIRVARLIGEAGFQPWRPPVGLLVGRAKERTRLHALLDAVTAQSGAAIVVEGEAGMGKSRLMAELAATAPTAGFVCTWVDNVSYGSQEPYRFGRALAQAIADEHGTDSGAMARRLLFTEDTPPERARLWAGAVAAIARDAAFSGWEEEAPLAPVAPAEVATAIRDLARRYMERLLEVSGPRVLFIDDLHWLDPSSAGMLDEIVQMTRSGPMLIVIGMRPGPSPAPASIGALEHIWLEGLDEVQTKELAAVVAGTAIDESEAKHLHERTAGNPLFITETVRALLEDPPPMTPAGRLGLGDGRSGKGMPMTLRALLGARIDALSEEARTVLRVASVIGVTFRETIVADVFGERVERDIYEGLGEASLIVAVDGAGGWRFSHPLIHDAAYSGLLGSSRRRLHARVADLLDAQSGRGAIGAVARHRAAAGDGARAVPMLAEAAEEALAVGASAEAASFWTAAADLLGGGEAAEAYRQRARTVLEAMPLSVSPTG
jgi:adenylate cyclase